MVRSTRDILLQTDRPEEARAFYEGVLGLLLVQDQPNMRGFEGGALRLFIEPGPPLGPVLEFTVNNFASAKSQLLAAGCTVAQEDASVPNCYLRDPFGLLFNLSER